MAKRRAPRPSPPASSSTSASTSPSSGASPTLNPLAARLAGLSDADRKKLLDHEHPEYTARSASYRRLLDAYEGLGGFLDGDYLKRYPNETQDDFNDRKSMARYHNYYRALVNIYVRHVFRKGVVRTADSLPELEAWWKDVDGAGTGIDRFMMRGAKLALAAGISGALVDKEPTPAAGPSKADDTARVLASWFPATSIVDWDIKAGELRGVKLRECAERDSILEAEPTGEDAEQWLIWVTGTESMPGAWVRLDAKGEVVEQSAPTVEGTSVPIDFIPLAIVRPDPSAEQPFCGYALGGDGKVFVSLLNRCSEQDEVLRDQAFSILTCEVPAEGGDVEKAKQQIGSDIGTTRALVVQGSVDYISPDMAAPKTLQENIDFLIREIYRMAHVRFERESLDAESGESIRLQFTELNEQLANLAVVLQDAEMLMAKSHYAWTNPGDRATVEAGFAAANVVIQYPREFFLADLLAELEKWAAAIKLDLGPQFEHYAKNRVVDELAPELPADLRDTIRKEIDGMEQNRDRALEEAQARFGTSMGRIAGGGKKPKPGEGDVEDDDDAAGGKAAA